MSQLRIYRPARNAMQSGPAGTHRVRAEFEPEDRKDPDPLMGWPGSRDTRSQIRMTFANLEEAVDFAKREGYDYTVVDERPVKAIKPKAYADNFRYDRVL